MNTRIWVIAAEKKIAERRADVQSGTAPRWDICDVADALNATIISYDDGTISKKRLAALALSRSAPGDVLVCFGEDVALPLLTLGMFHRRRRVITIGHSLAPLKKILLHRCFWNSRLAGLIVYNEQQQRLAQGRLAWPAQKIHVMPFQADTTFFAPGVDGLRRADGSIVSIGGEHRDYPTFITACGDLPVETSMGSQWARVTRCISALPINVTNRRRSWDELRSLYQHASVVVVPLLPCGFPAGISSALEAMACGAPVIVTRTEGLTGVLPDNTVRWVPAGDVVALRTALDELRRDPSEANALGQRARSWVAEHASLQRYVERFTTIVRASLS